MNPYTSSGSVATMTANVSGNDSLNDLGDGPRALPPVEIRTDDGPYDYDARYNPGRSEYFVPARLEPALIHVAEEAAVLAHRALGLRHISRTDLILGTDGVPWHPATRFLPLNPDDPIGVAKSILFGWRDIAAWAAKASTSGRPTDWRLSLPGATA